MKALGQLLSTMILLMTIFAGVAIFLMMLHICLGAAFNLVLPTVNLNTLTVVAAWYMIGVTFLPMANTQPLSVNIAAGFLSDAFRKTVRYVVALLSAIAFGFIAYLTFEEAMSQTQIGEMWETSTGFFPVWPARWLLPCAFIAMSLREICKVFVPEAMEQADASSAGSD